MEPAHKLSACIECNVCSAEVAIHDLSSAGVSWTAMRDQPALVKLARFVLDRGMRQSEPSSPNAPGCGSSRCTPTCRSLSPRDRYRAGRIGAGAEKLFGLEGTLVAPARSTRVFLRGKQWNGFVRLADEHKSALIESGTIEPETINDIEEAYRLRDGMEEE